jgi:hypothetical protein
MIECGSAAVSGNQPTQRCRHSRRVQLLGVNRVLRRAPQLPHRRRRHLHPDSTAMCVRLVPLDMGAMNSDVSVPNGLRILGDAVEPHGKSGIRVDHIELIRLPVDNWAMRARVTAPLCARFECRNRPPGQRSHWHRHRVGQLHSAWAYGAYAAGVVDWPMNVNISATRTMPSRFHPNPSTVGLQTIWLWQPSVTTQMTMN